MNEIAQTIVSEVADEEDVDPVELEPLYTSVDLSAIQTLFDNSSDVTRVEIEYTGYEIIVEGGGNVWIDETD